MKICRKCGELKSPNDFYDKSNKCKECTKADVKANRASKIDYYRDYDRKRGDLEHRVAAQAEYRNRESSKQAHLERLMGYRQRAKDKIAARSAISNALRDGRIVRPSVCAQCGEGGDLHAHHEDHKKHFDVIWLCPTCHGQRHRELNEMRRHSERHGHDQRTNLHTVSRCTAEHV